jgi:acyl-coenzyme A thioesterase PaaI-like protein
MIELPPAPIAELVGFDLVELGEGRASFAMDPAERHYNPLGTVHGGIAATLLDSAMVATAEARLTDEDGRLLAHATSTCLIM